MREIANVVVLASVGIIIYIVEIVREVNRLDAQPFAAL